MLRKKKGISEVVSWVLLLGFTIGLAVTVFTWTRDYTKTQTESTVSYIEGRIECQEIMINVLVNKSQPCQGFIVSNRGKLKIDKILVRIFNNNNPVGSYMYNLSLNPLQNQYVFNSSLTGNRIEVMPLTKVSNKLVGCKEKTIKENC